MPLLQTRKVFSNAGALFIIQIASYILPFLMIPYLTRVLGASMYGVIAFALAIVQIACVITDYGFGLSATHQVAKQQTNRAALRNILSAVTICKIGLIAPVIGLLSMFICIQDKYDEYQIIFWLLLLPIIGQTFQPIWFFQGIERMAFITIYTVLSRIAYIGLVVCWVSQPKDYYWVIIANGVSNISAAVIGVAIIFRLGYRPTWCGWDMIKTTFKDSTQFFWARAAVATYTAGGAFFLGITSSPLQVSYYSAAEQLYKGAQSLLSPITQALYPHMSQHKNFRLFFIILKASIALSLTGLIIGMFLSPWFIKLIFGAEFESSNPILIVFMVCFAITTPSMLLGYPFLGALGNSKAANMSVIFAGFIQVSLLTTCYFLHLFEAIYVVWTVLIVEAFVLAYRIRQSSITFKKLQNNI
jgi:PST family polysaccharide transporter